MKLRGPKFWRGSCLLLGAALFLFPSCSERKETGESAVRINAYALTADEFGELFSEQGLADDTPENRANFLNNLITQKLLLEEGQRLGLDTEKAFLRSIERFWEQSLLKSVVDRKVREISENITVTESEMEAYYRKWLQENPATSKPLEEVRSLIEWRIRKAKEAQAMEEWTNGLVQKAQIKLDKKALGIE